MRQHHPAVSKRPRRNATQDGDQARGGEDLLPCLFLFFDLPLNSLSRAHVSSFFLLQFSVEHIQLETEGAPPSSRPVAPTPPRAR